MLPGQPCSHTKPEKIAAIEATVNRQTLRHAIICGL